jgi:hypothetical protein
MFSPVSIPCRLVDGTPTVTVVRHDRRVRQAVIRLTRASLFTVAVRDHHLAELAEALREGDSLGVPCRHATYGDWLLGVHPHQWWVNPAAPRLPMELYLLLPEDQQAVVVFTADEVEELLDALMAEDLVGAEL